MNAFSMHGTLYSASARFDRAVALTEDEMRRFAPSIFAVAPHESRSERFRAIPTIEILRGLTKEGFVPVAVKQGGTRDVGKANFTKHLIRLRKLDDGKQYSVGDTVVEMLLKNGNDGTSAYDLLAGLYRIACMNSLVTKSATIEEVKIRHSGDVMNKVIEGTFTVLNQAEKALVAPQDWSQRTVTRGAAMALAEAAHVLRFAEDGEVKTPIQPQALLAPRRQEDRATDLWTTFNVVQENVIRGGMSARGRDTAGRLRTHTAREIKGIDQDVKLNRALFVLGERMAELLGGAKIAA